VSFALMRRAVAETYQIREDVLTKPNRRSAACRPRYVLMALARECLGMSYPRIGMLMGRDHTTIIHGCKRYAESPCERTAGVLRRYMALVNHERGI
jgi:chromosomal replication initiation ATPase DnaA